tara:strand:+ start:167 stop:310 length:144 start_codon:yes stop_codon:yes gene_type:complete
MNPFFEFSLSEMVEAYTYFTDIHDYEACSLIGEAFHQTTSVEFKNLI